MIIVLQCNVDDKFIPVFPCCSGVLPACVFWCFSFSGILSMLAIFDVTPVPNMVCKGRLKQEPFAPVIRTEHEKKNA